MKILFYTLIFILTASILTTCALFAQVPEQTKPPDIQDYYEAGYKIIDSRFTPPDCYELLCRVTFTNGLSVEQWEEVTEEHYYQYLEGEVE